jgi:phosphoglycerate kinase
MKTIKGLKLKDKKVIVRCDFDVPLFKEGGISDDYRIRQAIPTILHLIQNQAKVILIGHLGRPKGQVVEELRVDSVAEKLSELLNRPVVKLDNCVGADVTAAAGKMKAGDVVVLENLRFHKEEEENDEKFAKSLAELGDIYINNAFANSHRKHASMVGIPKFLPSAAGFALAKEVEILGGLAGNSEKPLVIIIGGAKIEETKINLIEKFSDSADSFILGGLIYNEIKEKQIKFSRPEKIIFPAGDLKALDINQESIKIFQEKIYKAKTIFWNGPFGKTENKEYMAGTQAIAWAITESGAFSVAGGGDTVNFINKIGFFDKFSHVSTGGGAMMAFLSGEKLPGLEALN